jgi:hypothetical protein
MSTPTPHDTLTSALARDLQTGGGRSVSALRAVLNLAHDVELHWGTHVTIDSLYELVARQFGISAERMRPGRVRS